MDFLTINEDFYYKLSSDEQDDFVRAKTKNKETNCFIEHPILTDKKNNWIAEDYSVIQKNHCRKCKEELKPYKDIYERYFWTNLYKKFHYGNGYCKRCAQEKSGLDNLYKYTLDNFKSEEKNGSGYQENWTDFEVYKFESKRLDYDPECYREAYKWDDQ